MKFIGRANISNDPKNQEEKSGDENEKERERESESVMKISKKTFHYFPDYSPYIVHSVVTKRRIHPSGRSVYSSIV